MRKIGLKKKFFSGKKFFFSIFFAEIYRENFCALYSRSKNDKSGQKFRKYSKKPKKRPKNRLFSLKRV